MLRAEHRECDCRDHNQHERERECGVLCDARTVKGGVDRRERHGASRIRLIAREERGRTKLTERPGEAQDDPGEEARGDHRQGHIEECLRRPRPHGRR